MPHQEPPASSRRDEEGFVYRGDPDLIHVLDGRRRKVGSDVADRVDELMRWFGEQGRYTARQRAELPLCPGCYMPVIFNAAVELAKRNGQDLEELGLTMSSAFLALAERGHGADGLERVHVIDGDR